MLQSWDVVNIIGIFIEIIGFVFLLSQIMNWLNRRESKKMGKITDEYIKAINNNRPMPDLERAQERYNEKTIQRGFEFVGIVLVIIGLGLQLVSVFIEKGI